MFLFNINHSSLFIIFILSSVDSISFSTKLKSIEYRRLAKYCYIDDYSIWLQKQHEFMIWFDLAKLLRLPIHENKHFQHELKQYRLQYACLRTVERLPILIGPG